MRLQQHILQLLERLGLTPSEASVYLTIYQHPRLSLSELQRKVRCSRATVYRAYERLRELGLVLTSEAGWRKNIQVVSLAYLAERLAKEQRQLRKVELELKKMNNLIHVSACSGTPDPIHVLTDEDEIQEKSYEIVERPWNRIMGYGSAECLIDVVGSQTEHDFKKIRARQGKYAEAIFTELGEYTQELLPQNRRELRQIKLAVDPARQNYMIYIYGNEVTVWQQDLEIGKRAVIISEPLLVKNYTDMFQAMWAKL